MSMSMYNVYWLNPESNQSNKLFIKQIKAKTFFVGIDRQEKLNP